MISDRQHNLSIAYKKGNQNIHICEKCNDYFYAHYKRQITNGFCAKCRKAPIKRDPTKYTLDEIEPLNKNHIDKDKKSIDNVFSMIF